MTKGMKYPPFARPGTPQRMKTPVATPMEEVLPSIDEFLDDLPSIDDSGTPMTWRKLRFIIKGHILGQASLTGLRGHG